MNYDDILYLKPEFKHKKMSKEKRAAQFSPFAALTGYDLAIKEEARITSDEAILSDDMAQDISMKLQSLQNNPRKCKIIYFKFKVVKNSLLLLMTFLKALLGLLF